MIFLKSHRVETAKIVSQKPDPYDILTSLDQKFFNLNKISGTNMCSVFLIKPNVRKQLYCVAYQHTDA